VSKEDPNRADPDSGEPILHILQPFGNHNGGQLAFGPDGYLYAGFGDGGALGDPEDNAQNPATLLGAILRLDVDGAYPYAIPEDNPYEGKNGRLLETWQIGLRNPWAFSFDRVTGALYVSDVGQEGPEELNFLPAGVSGINFGWPLREGESCYEAELCPSDGLQAPILTYEHDEGCAIIGGYVYRGWQYPSLAGTYFFSDFCRGTLWSLRFTEDGWQRAAAYETETEVSSFGEDNAGELYVLTYSSGEVWQIVSVQE
jgi:glucose/arabinose dehydrogenase